MIETKEAENEMDLPEGWIGCLAIDVALLVSISFDDQPALEGVHYVLIEHGQDGTCIACCGDGEHAWPHKYNDPQFFIPPFYGIKLLVPIRRTMKYSYVKREYNGKCVSKGQDGKLVYGQCL